MKRAALRASSLYTIRCQRVISQQCLGSSLLNYRSYWPTRRTTALQHIIENNGVGSIQVESSMVMTTAHRLLEEFSESRVIEINPRLWMDAQDCVWQLSNARTVDSVDLSFLILDKLLEAKALLLDEVGQNGGAASDLVAENTTFLRDWDMWHSVLLNWQQVSRAELGNISSHPKNSRISSPDNVLAMLDAWSTKMSKAEGRSVTYTTSKALSLLIDITGRHGTLLSAHFKALPLQRNGETSSDVLKAAEFSEMLFFRMMVLDDERIKAFPPSTTNLNTCLQLWSKAGRVDRAWNVLKQSLGKVQPDMRSYNCVLQAYAAAKNGEEAEQVLYELCRTSSSESIQVQPDVTSWNIVLNAWANSRNKKMAAERVQKLLLSMMTCSHDERYIGYDRESPIYVNEAVKPNLISFNTALRAWARLGEAQTCERMLNEMKGLHESGILDDPPDAFSYGTVMNAFAKAGLPEKAEALSDEMYKKFMENGSAELKPTVAIQTCIIDGYSRSIAKAIKEKNSSKALEYTGKALKIFKRMQELQQFGFLKDGPDTMAYNVMMLCFLRSCDAVTFPHVNPGAEHADRLLAEMKNSRRSERAAPTFASYSMVVQAWLTRRDGTDRALNLLDEAWKVQGIAERDKLLKPDPLSVQCIIAAFCRSGRPDIGYRLLVEVCNKLQQDPSSIEPTIASFGTVLGALARSGMRDSAPLASELVKQMESLHHHGLIRNGPDSLIYKTLISCWSHSKHKGGAQEAQSVIAKMRRLASKGDESMQPDLQSYNEAIYACSCGDVKPVEAETLLSQMLEDFNNGITFVKPDLRSFTTTLTAWSRLDHPDAMLRTENLFEKMENLHALKQIQLTTFAYNIIINCLASAGTTDACLKAENMIQRMIGHPDENVKPDAVTYGSIIKAYRALGDADKVEVILRSMIEMYISGNLLVKPRAFHFDQAARAWSDSLLPHAADRSYALFCEMQRLSTLADFEFDLATFNTILLCLASKQNKDYAQRVEEMLLTMTKQVDENLRPNVLSFTCSIKAWVWAGETQRAETVLHDMVKELVAGNTTIKPQQSHFKELAQAWSNASVLLDSKDTAGVFFREMLALNGHGFSIPITAFNGVLQALVKVPGGVKQIEELLQMLKEQSNESLKPNSHTYGYLVEALVNVGETDKTEEILLMMMEQFSNGVVRLKPLSKSVKLLVDALADTEPSQSERIRVVFAEKENMIK